MSRSDSNSKPNVRHVAGVPDHRVSKKQTNEAVNNVRTLTSSLHSNDRGHYAVDTLEVRSKIGRVDICRGLTETPNQPGLSQV